MTQSAPVLSKHFDLMDDAPETRWRVWLVIILLALLIHLVAFMTHIEWSKPLPPAPVEVQQIDPKKLDEIRKRWNEQDKQLLLNKNKSKDSAAEAPKDARYMSDRNIRVEKEQRARDHVILPKPGSPTRPQDQTKEETPRQKSQRSQTQSRALPKLGNLGVPFHLAETPKQKQEGQERQHQAQASQPGGEQYVDDKKLPEGSENLLNAEESVYYSFYARLYEAIGPLWSSRLREIAPGTRVQPGEYTTAVDVVLDRQGNLIEVRMLHSSGIREFDQAVDMAWKRIGRFPNPPSGLLNPAGEVHTGWNFTVAVGGGGMGVQLMPPERTY